MNQLLGAAVLCVAAQCARCLQTVALQAVFSNSLRADLVHTESELPFACLYQFLWYKISVFHLSGKE